MAVTLTLAERIERASARLGYPVDTTEGAIGVYYVRGMDVNGRDNGNPANNSFNDLRVLTRAQGGKLGTLRTWVSTVEPGIKYVRNRINPKGAAFIVNGQQRAWQVGMHRGNHEALIQTGGSVTVTRDDNEDVNPAGDERDTGWFGINQHGGYDALQSEIGGASAGCLVTPAMKDQAEFVRLVKSDPRYVADHKYIFATTVFAAPELLVDGPFVPATPIAVSGASTDQRRRMAKAILDFEARRDGQGHLAVYQLPSGDGGGRYEVAGINERYHPQEASHLKALIEAGRYDEAEIAAGDVILSYTKPAEAWTSDPGVEFYLRDCVFNRGPTGAARILQRAVGADEDGIVGTKTLAAVATRMGA